MATELIRLSSGTGWRVLWTREVPYNGDHPAPPTPARVGGLLMETRHDFDSLADAQEFVRGIGGGRFEVPDAALVGMAEAAKAYPAIQRSPRERRRNA